MRRQRSAPLRDDVAPSGAHGLLLSALARTGAEASDAKLTAAAKEVAAYIREKLINRDGALLARQGRSTLAAPRDYALVIDGLLTHHAHGGDASNQQIAQKLLTQLKSLYADDTSGRFFVTDADLEPGLVTRVLAGPPEGRDLPGAKEAILLALAKHDLGDAAWREAIAAQIATDINESPNQPRGDQVLALQQVVQE